MGRIIFRRDAYVKKLAKQRAAVNDPKSITKMDLVAIPLAVLMLRRDAYRQV